MKTVNRIIFLAIFSIALTACNDNGPVSVDNNAKDGIKSSLLVDNARAGHEVVVPLHPAHVGVTNSDFGTGTCPTPPEGQEGWYGWHFVMPGNNVFTALSVEFENAGVISADPFPGSLFIAHPTNKHAYVWTPTDDTLLSGQARTETSSNPPKQFVLSHVCGPEDNGQSLEVTKTVDTYYIRTHDWSIEKEVETEEGHELDDIAKIWLYTDGEGDENAEWTVEVTYEGYEDSDWNVSGTITIENIGDNVKIIASITDLLAGDAIDVDCGDAVIPGHVLNPALIADGDGSNILTCTYSEDVDGQIEGYNVVTVYVEDEEDPYGDTKPIVWGDPDSEINAIVNVVDISDLFGTVDLGTLDAADFEEGESETFDYDKDFAFADYVECGAFRYDNTASVIGDDDVVLDSADASLKVNVQCFVYESAWALDMNDPLEVIDVFSFCDNGFNNWGWSNFMGTGSYVLDLYAGAGQCEISKGTYVGYVEINYNGGFNYEYHIEPGFELTEYHIYAGSTMFPQQARGRNGFVNTTAPGQYSILSPLSGDIYVIAHGVVGLPDPNFGP